MLNLNSLIGTKIKGGLNSSYVYDNLEYNKEIKSHTLYKLVVKVTFKNNNYIEFTMQNKYDLMFSENPIRLSSNMISLGDIYYPNLESLKEYNKEVIKEIVNLYISKSKECLEIKNVTTYYKEVDVIFLISEYTKGIGSLIYKNVYDSKNGTVDFIDNKIDKNKIESYDDFKNKNKEIRRVIRESTFNSYIDFDDDIEKIDLSIHKKGETPITVDILSEVEKNMFEIEDITHYFKNNTIVKEVIKEIEQSVYYVYKHYYIDDNGDEIVFYIGKGTGIVNDINDRIFDTNRNNYWIEFVEEIKDKYEIKADVIRYFRDLSECLNFEKELQDHYWKIGQCKGCADVRLRFNEKILRKFE